MSVDIESRTNGLDDAKADTDALVKQLTQPMEASLLAASKAAYAQAMDEDEGGLSFLDVDWGALMQRGARGAVTFGYWRATKALDYEDIGLMNLSGEEREALNAVVQLPKGRLLVGARGNFDPISEFQSVENKGRATLKAFSVPTDLGPFIPLGEVDDKHPDSGWHYKAFKTAIEEVERQFYAVRDKMRERWPDLVTATIAYWSGVADKLFGDMLSAGRLPTRREMGVTRKVLRDGVEVIDPQDPWSDELPEQVEWVSWFLNTKIRPFMLSVDEACNRVRFKLTVQPIQPPQSLLKAQAEAALDDAELQLRQDFVKSAGNAIDGFFRDVVFELRARLYDTCADALAAMDNNEGRIPTRNQTAIRAFIEYVETVKVWPDRDIEDQIDEMRAMLNMDPRSREIAQEDIRKLFRKIAAEAKLTAQEIDRMDERTSRQIPGVPDDGTELELVAGRARREIKLLDDSSDGISFQGRASRQLDLQN